MIDKVHGISDNRGPGHVVALPEFKYIVGARTDYGEFGGEVRTLVTDAGGGEPSDWGVVRKTGPGFYEAI